MTTPLEIQDAIEQRVNLAISQLAINRTASNGADGRPPVASQFWIAYEGGSFERPPDCGYGDGFTQDRTLTFASYVQVRDLQRDYREALQIHEALLSLINGFFPALEGMKQPLIALDDAPIAVRSDQGTVYRYRARYQTIVAQNSTRQPDLLHVTRLSVALFRSPADEVAVPPPVATKDAEIVVVE